jgi:hypothetical protein
MNSYQKSTKKRFGVVVGKIKFIGKGSGGTVVGGGKN